MRKHVVQILRIQTKQNEAVRFIGNDEREDRVKEKAEKQIEPAKKAIQAKQLIRASQSKQTLITLYQHRKNELGKALKYRSIDFTERIAKFNKKKERRLFIDQVEKFSSFLFSRLSKYKNIKYLFQKSILILCVIGLIGCSIGINANQVQTTAELFDSNENDVNHEIAVLPMSSLAKRDQSGYEDVDSYSSEESNSIPLVEPVMYAINQVYGDDFMNGAMDPIFIPFINQLDFSGYPKLLSENDKNEVLSQIALFTQLRSLNISGLGIRDIDTLAELSHLRILHADDNQIRDLRPLAMLAELFLVSMSNNPIVWNDENKALLTQWKVDLATIYPKPAVMSLSMNAKSHQWEVEVQSQAAVVDKYRLEMRLRVKDVSSIDVIYAQNIVMDCDHGNKIRSITVEEKDIESEDILISLDLVEDKYAVQLCFSNQYELQHHYTFTLTYQIPKDTTTIPQITTAPIQTSVPKVTSRPQTTRPVTTSTVPTSTNSQKTTRITTTKLPEVASTKPTTTPPTTTKPATTKPKTSMPITTTPVNEVRDLPIQPDIPNTSDEACAGVDKKICPKELSQQVQNTYKEMTKVNQADKIAQLSIASLGINLSVFQAQNNDYYLKHDRYGNENKQGELFLDHKYSSGDPVKVIYGHNMRDGSRFASLLHVLDMEKELLGNVTGHLSVTNSSKTLINDRINQTINDTINETINEVTKIEHQSTTYAIVGAFFYDTNKDWFDYTRTKYGDIGELMDFVSDRNVLEHVSAMSDTHDFLLLSTCNYDSRGDRFVVVLQNRRDIQRMEVKYTIRHLMT